MKKTLLVLTFLCAHSAWADGKASVLTFQDASKIPHVWSCRLRYNESALTVGQALQLMETNTSLPKVLKDVLGIKAGKMDEILLEKAIAHQKEKKWMIGECSKATLDDLFEDVANMKNCTQLEKLVKEMNKIPIARENFNYSDRCNAGPGAKSHSPPAGTPSAR